LGRKEEGGGERKEYVRTKADFIPSRGDLENDQMTPQIQ